jgi:hypothetical protein
MFVFGIVFLMGVANISSAFSTNSGQGSIVQILAVGSIILLATGIIGLIASFKS